MNNPKVHVFIVDDHPAILVGLQTMLEEVNEIHIVGTASNGQELLEQLQTSNVHPDVILMDIEMKNMDGYRATSKVKQYYPDIRVIMLTMKDQIEHIQKAKEQGADAFLSKQNGKKEIVQAILNVLKTDQFFAYTNLESEKQASQASIEYPQIEASESGIVLTDREKKIISLICQEYRLEDIATRLHLSLFSVEMQRKNILNKLQVRTNAGIVREAISRNLCDYSEQ